MKRLFVLLAVIAMFLAISDLAIAYNPFETVEQSRQRHSAENYEYQQEYGTPLGGYPETFGDPAPRGTEYPGYKSNDYNSNFGYDYNIGY